MDCIVDYKVSNFPSKYVTGFKKTDQCHTRPIYIAIFHFIGLANGYTHTLHIHSGITRLS